MNKKIALLFPAAVICATAINKLIYTVSRIEPKYARTNCFTSAFGDINYVVSGSGKPLLLLHSPQFGGSLYEWKSCIASLSQDYKVYAIDLLGFGFSDKPRFAHTAYLHASIINSFIKNVIKQDCFVVASKSSCIFAIAAHALDESSIKKLVLIEPSAASDVLPSKNDRLIRQLLELPIIGTSVSNFLGSKFYLRYVLKLPKQVAAQFYNSAHFGMENNRYTLASSLAHYMNANVDHLIKDIKIPVTIASKANVDGTLREVAPLAYTNLPHIDQPKEFCLLCKKHL